MLYAPGQDKKMISEYKNYKFPVRCKFSQQNSKMAYIDET